MAGTIPIEAKGLRERIGDEIAIGHLTSATVVSPGTVYRAHHDADLHADAEVTVELGRDLDSDADLLSHIGRSRGSAWRSRSSTSQVHRTIPRR